MVSFFKKYGRKILSLYDTHPMSMNSAVGGFVYVAGELITQTSDQDDTAVSFSEKLGKVDWPRVGTIGLLGAAENGPFMTTWYNFLNKRVGGDVRTKTVITKCVWDQLFFATQQDSLFLAVCAFSHTEKLAEVLAEVKQTFLTTWLMDCSLWPIVNFVGFAVVPFQLLPTYMAVVSLGWQTYISSVAAGEGEFKSDDFELEKVFNQIDTDHSGYIDDAELKNALGKRGIKVSALDIQNMIADADATGAEEVPDGKVSFEEFKIIFRRGDHLRTATLWSKICCDVSLHKGAKSVLERLSNISEEGAPLNFTNKHSELNALDVVADEKHRDAFKTAGYSLSFLSIMAISRRLIFKI